MTTPTRKLPVSINSDGKSTASSKLTDKSMKVPGEVRIPPKKVIPVIFVPGIMGSNLRAKHDIGDSNPELQAGEEAWRPPNGIFSGIAELYQWRSRKPPQRQLILHGPSLAVDDRGDISFPIDRKLDIDEDEARNRGWGQIHWDSYGVLLCTLQQNLNSIVWSNYTGRGGIHYPWLAVQNWDRKKWNTAAVGAAAPLSKLELEAASSYYFPIYAYGYNWLLSNEEAATQLVFTIEQILAHWRSRQRSCDKVILVTHSMGGLVARACAKKRPAHIAGIIHGVMPALGAPVCFRRIAYGTEYASPQDRNWIKREKADAFATIAGKTPAETTPILATSPGPLELLPNHLYPRPWLLFRSQWKDDPIREVLQLPKDSPYDLYRDTKSWYRMIDPSLADPAQLHNGNVIAIIRRAIKQAERFHTETLDSYYHPNSYAFFGNDKSEWCFGSCQWITKNITPDVSLRAISDGKADYTNNQIGVRSVWAGKHITAVFNPAPQDTSGDGTVPVQSGRGPLNKVKQAFETAGYDHQESYKDSSMLALTQHLIIKIVQDIK